MAFFKKRERAEPEQIPKENDCEDLLISTYLGRNNITREWQRKSQQFKEILI